MSGGVTFDPVRLAALADYATDRVGPMPSEKLAVILWMSDFEHFRRFGRSITGATWCKGTPSRPVYVRELGEGWFRRYTLSRSPLWQRALAWVLTAWAVWEARA